MKTVLITGASSGIGKETARQFLTAGGYTVYAAARRVERMDDLRVMGARVLPLDVTDEASCAACIKAIEQESGGVDILVNNAGYGAYGPVEAVPLDDAFRQLDVNLCGAVRMIQLVIPHMRAAGGGRIINISSAGGRVTTYMGGWYHAAKYALEAVSDSLRRELLDDHIEVVLIEPGGVRSAWGRIAADHLERTAQGTVYADRASHTAEMLRTAYGQDNTLLTPPSKVARVILRAAEAKRPRTRYLFGFGARGLVAANALLPDRAFDRLINGIFAGK